MTQRVITAALAVGLFVFVAACQRSNDETQTMTAPTPSEVAAFNNCPMAAPGDVNVSVADTKTGVALTFTTDQKGDVANLRQRAQHLAAMYTSHSGQGMMMWRYMHGRGMGPGMMGRGMGPGQGMGPGMMGRRGMGQGYGRGPMPAANATVSDVDHGARIELVPKDTSQLDALRQRARMHQQRMAAGACWMMRGASATATKTKAD